jgi:drug/metabolite transporter (DMT)-like permease
VSGADPRPAATRRDDRLALATIALGAAVALLGLRAPLALVTGVGLGLAGVLLAVRGDRPVPSPRLMMAALVLAVGAVVAVALLGLWEEWVVGMRLSEGAPPAVATAAVRPYVRAAAALRSIALFAALAMLLGATFTRFAPAPPAKEPSGK